MNGLTDKDRQLVERVQRLERCAWTSLTVAAIIWETLTQLEKLSFIEERIRTLAFLEATPAK
jgi:hypothetical protein